MPEPQTPTPVPPSPKETRIAELTSYLIALKNKRMELLTGAQSYSIGSRSLARYTVALDDLNTEIKKTERELFLVENDLPDARIKHVIYHDFP